MLSPSCSANLTNSNLIATADPPILGIAFLLRQGVNDQSDQVLTISPVHTTLRERRPAASRPVGEGSSVRAARTRCRRWLRQDAKQCGGADAILKTSQTLSAANDL